MKVSDEELKTHYKTGTETCLVCESKLVGGWTDYNGQIRCSSCGTTYQVLGSHLSEKELARLEITKDEVARKYCDCFTCVPMLRDYWRETRRPIPFGLYFADNPIPKSQYDDFYNWLASNSENYRPDLEREFNWQAVMKSAAQVST